MISRLVVLAIAALPCLAQEPAGHVAASQVLPAKKSLPAFDVASVKPSRPGGPVHESVSLGLNNFGTPAGGYFSAKGVLLTRYISFAFSMTNNQRVSLFPKLPDWARTEVLDIEARAEGNPTKDEMRLMMQSLLAERFKLAVHTERRELPALGFVLVKPGKTGPQLRPHSEGPPCPEETPDPSASGPAQRLPFDQRVAGGFRLLCGGMIDLPGSVPGRIGVGARNLTMEFIAEAMSVRGSLGRPMVDRTGLPGTFDFLFEWTPDPVGTAPPADAANELSGPSFVQALRDQWGIKLESTKAIEQIFVLDHIERLAVN